MSPRIVSFLGLFFLIGLAWAFSNARKSVNWRTVIAGVSLQIFFAILVLKTAPGRWFFEKASLAITGLISFTDRGAEFVWGPLYRGMPGNYSNPDQPLTYLYNTASGTQEPMGMVFLLNALMPIIFFAALMSVLYHIGVMKVIITTLAKVMKKFMGTSGSESLSASANIFVGQTEAPLVVKPFVETMTRSELHAVMAGGFATVAGGVMAAYTTFGIDPGHLLAASVMSAPAALVAAKLFYPETEESVTAGEMKISLEKNSANLLDAACNGAGEGLKLVGNVAAMLLAFIALIALADWILGSIDTLITVTLFGADAPIGLSLSWIFGKLFFPIAVILGVPWEDCTTFGALLGTRMAINEFVAYIQLAQVEPTISPRTFVLATYAFCGFANFSSIAIQIGGIGGIAPSRKRDLAQIGMRAMFAGTMASFMTAAVVGTLVSDDEMSYQHYKRKTVQFMGDRYQEKIDLLEGFKKDFPESDFQEDATDLIKTFEEDAGSRIQELRAQIAHTRPEEDPRGYRALVDKLRSVGTPDALKLSGALKSRGPP